MTHYRAVSNGQWDWLEYEAEERFLFFRWKTWKPVPKAYCRWPYPRDHFALVGRDPDCYVNSCDENIADFIRKWPDIGDYMAHFAKAQGELNAKWNAKEREYEKKRGTVRPLTAERRP
jgi:hypothetical protein